MATLSRGSYTYGNKTWAVIQTIVGASVGDTVWDTTYNKRRVWDGSNFVHGSQLTALTAAGFLDGGIATVSPSTNNRVSPQAGAADTECVIGVVENGKGSTAGVSATVTYHGDVRALVVASGANPANTGEYLEVATGAGDNGYAITDTAGVGTFGQYLDASTTTTGLRRILFRPVERN
jgi:hypothetical protein